MPAPSNDNWASANTLTLSSGTASFSVDTTSATLEASEPLAIESFYVYDTEIGNTAWYRWTAPKTGQAVVDLAGSDFDTVAAVYATGGSIGALSLLACNDDAFDGRPDNTSQLIWPAVGGSVYDIQVGGYFGDAGSITGKLYYGPDNFADAKIITLSSGSASTSWSLAGATVETGEPVTFAGYGGTVTASIWFAWTAPSDGVARFNTFDSDFDTTAAVFTGGSVSGLTLLDFNDNYVGGETDVDTSIVSWTASGSTTYHMQVGSWGGTAGQIGTNLYFDAFATPSSPDPGFDSGTASAYRVELRELNSSGFTVTTSSVDLVTFSVNWRLNAPGAFDGTGVLGTVQTDVSNVGARELIVYKDSTAIWGGYLTFLDVDEDSKQVRIGAEGYWSRARSRVMRGNQIYKPITNSGTSWKADVIAWDIIDHAQGAPYGDMGWVYGGHTGTRKDCKRVYYGVDRTNIAEAIEALAREGYFDFAVDVRATPTEGNVARFRTWAERGSDVSDAINFTDANAMTLSYQISSSDMATVIDVFGAVEGCRGVAATDDANQDVYGRIEGRPIDMETDEQAEVDATAARFIDQHSVPAINATVAYLEGVGPDLTDYDLGDTVAVTPDDGLQGTFTGRVVGRELAVEAGRAVITVEVER